MKIDFLAISEDIKSKINEIPGNLKHFFKKGYKELKWTKLDTYIMRKFFPALLGSLLLFISIYELTQVFTEIRYINNVETAFIIKRYIYDGLYWILILQPFSFLFATVFVLSKMVNTREIIAMISTGSSIYRITFYMVLFTVAYYIFTVTFLADNVFFPSYQKSLIYKEVVFQRADLDQLDRLKDNNNFSIFGANNLLYIVSYYNAVSKTIEDITIVQFFDENELTNENLFSQTTNDSNEFMSTNIMSLESQRRLIGNYQIRIKLRIDAEEAYWDNTLSNWTFNNGTIRYMQVEGSAIPEEEFETKVLEYVVDTPESFEKAWYPVDAMTSKESKDYVERLKLSHQDWKESEAHRLSKSSYPIGIIIVVLAGIGIINVASRKASFIINLIISLGLFIVYYVMFAAGIALAGKGVLQPTMGAYMGAFSFSIISLFLYARTKT